MHIFDGTKLAFPVGPFNALHLTRFPISFRAQTKCLKTLLIIIFHLLDLVGRIFGGKVVRIFDGTKVAFPVGAFNALHLTPYPISFRAETKCLKALPIII